MMKQQKSYQNQSKTNEGYKMPISTCKMKLIH